MTRLSAERGQGGFILIGRFVEAIRETSIRRDILSILLLRRSGGDSLLGGCRGW